MKTFNAKVLNRGVVSVVTISALNRKQAMDSARKHGQVVNLSSSSGGSLFKRLTVADRVLFFQRLASMLTAKVGLSEALEVIHASFTGSVRDAAHILHVNILQGMSLSEAMAIAGPSYFPETVLAIVNTGSRGGDIAYAILEACRFEQELDAVKRESSKGISSALFGFIAAVLTILGSTMYVAPQIMGSGLVTVSAGAVDVGWIQTTSDVITWIAIGMSLLIGLLFFTSKVLRPFSPAAIDRVILRIPFYRDMVLAKSNYMVFFGLAVLLKAGLRLEEALSLTVDSAPKGELRNDLIRARDVIIKGSSQPWANSMRLLHPTDRAALATAQDRSQTAKTIENLAKQYQALYKSRIETFVPVMQLFSAILLSIAGYVLFGLSILPLLQSSTAILKSL